ncbi:MAG: hypothetical protein ISS47_03955 [Candidatus Omnitrophica bacterium]|nr:hypothetical protein [Candidatus Omnitrophota bacterium]
MKFNLSKENMVALLDNIKKQYIRIEKKKIQSNEALYPVRDNSLTGFTLESITKQYVCFDYFKENNRKVCFFLRTIRKVMPKAVSTRCEIPILNR